MKKSFNKKKNSIKNAILFFVFAAASVGLGAVGLKFGTSGLTTGFSVLSLLLGGVWTIVTGKSIAGAVKASKEDPDLIKEEPEVEKEIKKESEQIAFETGKKMRKYAQKATDEKYSKSVKEIKADFKTAKRKYKESDKNLADKATFCQSKKEREIGLLKARQTRNSTLESIPKKTTIGYKFAKGFAVTGAIVGTVLTLVGSYTLFDQFNSADVLANETGTTQQEFIDERETRDNSLNMAMGGIALVSTIAGAAVAGQSIRRRKSEIGNCDYMGKFISPEEEEPEE